MALASRTVSDLESVAETIDFSACVVECDVSNSQSVEDAVTTLKDTFGKVDTAVQCAGVLARERVTELSDDQMDWAIDVNLKGDAADCESGSSGTERDRGVADSP